MKGLTSGIEHRQHEALNNRAEASHRQPRRREKIIGCFKSPRQVQQFLSVHDQTVALFRPKRHLMIATTYRQT
ncbi:MAG: IS6 family transposase, partial [Marinovum sp.]|nr:IS6 family transposase [Marinovum sp.]